MAAIDPCITRHLHEWEQRFEIQVNGFQKAMSGIGLQVTDQAAARGNRGGGNGDYRVPSRLTRLDFPSFNREDVDSWIAKCDRFFALDGTPEGEKVTTASIALDENSFRWFQSLEQSTLGRLSWLIFSEALRIRFGSEFDSSIEELKRLVQKGSLDEYQEALDNLACRTDLNEAQKLQCYLGGLNPDLCNGLKLFAPRTLLEATRIARLQERSLDWMQKRSGFGSGNRTHGNW